MHRVTRFPGLMLLLSLILVAAAGCGGGNAAKRTPTVAPGAPTGLLVFSTDDNGPNPADYPVEDSEATLYDLDPRTGAIRWKSPTYPGQPIQQPVAIGTHAFFGIAANSLDMSTASPSGSVSIYAVDLATGRSTLLTTLHHVYSIAGIPTDLDLSITRLNTMTALLRYNAYQDTSSVAETLLAFTSTPDSPLWHVTLPDVEPAGVTPDVALVDGTVAVMAQDSATQAPILFEINRTNGTLLRKVVLPHVGCTLGGVFADGLVILAQTSSPTCTNGRWEIAAYALTDGTPTWKRAISDPAVVIYGAAAGLVLYSHVTFQGDNVTALSTIAVHANDGSQAWTTSYKVGYGVVGDATHLYYPVQSQDTQVACLDGANGMSVWTRTWPHTDHNSTFVPSNLVVEQGVVYVGLHDNSGLTALASPSTVYELSAATGSTLWHQTVPGALDDLTETDQP